MPNYFFPASPKDGDCFLREDGYIYRYDAARIWWDKLKRPIDYLEESGLTKVPYIQDSPDSIIAAIIKSNLEEENEVKE